MAIIITNDGDKIVGTIADRDAMTRKFDGMNVRVEDSIADVNTGGGEAVYQWNETQSRWMLTWKENKDNLTFITEIMQISGGQVTASHIPQNSLVWDCTIQSTINGADVIMYDVRPDVNADVISLGTTDHDGEYLVFTYGYGVIQAAVTAILSANAGNGSMVTPAQLALKANSADVYTKTASDSALALKADQATTYTKTEVDSAVSVKANSADVYTKTASDSALALKADAATTFTKTETNAAIQAVVGAAPAALDTLVEIAAQLAADETAAASLTTAVSLKAPLASPTFTGTVSGITKAMVGLGSVDNTADTAKPVSTAQQTALDAKAPLASPTFTGTVSGITKAMVGLGSVDNTADTAKPVSTAQQTALDAKAPLASPTFTGTPAAPTATAGTNTTQVATTAFVTAADALKANLASPTFTGTPAAPTAAAGTNTTQVATTAFVLANAVVLSTVNTVTGRVQDSDGNLRSVPFSNKTAAYTLVAADNGKNINITTGGITIPTNSVFAAGDIISIYNQSGTAQNVAWSGGTVYLMGTSTAKTSPLSLAGRGGLTIMFVTGGAAPEILVSGNV